jgi:hypothetical protein
MVKREAEVHPVDNKPSSASIDGFDELKPSHDTELVSSLGTENTHVPELQLRTNPHQFVGRQGWLTRAARRHFDPVRGQNSSDMCPMIVLGRFICVLGVMNTVSTAAAPRSRRRPRRRVRTTSW